MNEPTVTTNRRADELTARVAALETENQRLHAMLAAAYGEIYRLAALSASSENRA